MESDDNDILDVGVSLDIQPYQFEPLCGLNNQEIDENSSFGDSDINAREEADQDRFVNTAW